MNPKSNNFIILKRQSKPVFECDSVHLLMVRPAKYCYMNWGTHRLWQLNNDF